jgi:hypothetical protein
MASRLIVFLVHETRYGDSTVSKVEVIVPERVFHLKTEPSRMLLSVSRSTLSPFSSAMTASGRLRP